MCSYMGRDENGDAIYNKSPKLPKLKLKGTVKLHGTNASIAKNVEFQWSQSRERIIVVGDDNAGFAAYMKANEEKFSEFIKKIAKDNNVDLNIYTINIYGEWAGRGIPGGGAGIRLFPKAFYLFGFKVSKIGDPEFHAYWLDHSGYSIPEINCYNILDFPTFEVEIDVKEPWIGQQKIHDLTMEVERECPVSKQLLETLSQEEINEYPEGTYDLLIGEGIVWEVEYQGEILRFKTKGDKHSPKSKVRLVKSVDIEKIEKTIALMEVILPNWRLEQFLISTFDLANDGFLDVKLLGKYIQNVMQDTYKEEETMIAESGLIAKDLNAKIGIKARDYFFEKVEEYNTTGSLEILNTINE